MFSIISNNLLIHVLMYRTGHGFTTVTRVVMSDRKNPSISFVANSRLKTFRHFTLITALYPGQNVTIVDLFTDIYFDTDQQRLQHKYPQIKDRPGDFDKCLYVDTSHVTETVVYLKNFEDTTKFLPMEVRMDTSIPLPSDYQIRVCLQCL